jgi:hypothetical protein
VSQPARQFGAPSLALDEAEAAEAVRTALKQSGLPKAPIRPMRLGTNAVFAAGDDIVARVGRCGPSDTSAFAVAGARWLIGEGVSVVRPRTDSQPVDVGRLVVTFWDSLG